MHAWCCGSQKRASGPIGAGNKPLSSATAESALDLGMSIQFHDQRRWIYLSSFMKIHCDMTNETALVKSSHTPFHPPKRIQAFNSV